VGTSWREHTVHFLSSFALSKCLYSNELTSVCLFAAPLYPQLPMPAPANKLRPWWSYDVGLIHFVGMSTEHNYSAGSAQHQWLENDLMGVNRSVTPWIVFTGKKRSLAPVLYFPVLWFGCIYEALFWLHTHCRNLFSIFYRASR
jgi:hypothetical protein